jgi:dsDNA-binding SOS-regulon protein
MQNMKNIHPADELAAVREEIKQLQGVEADLRAKLLTMSDDEREGDQYRAFVVSSNRETVDKVSMIAALGREVVEPFIKTSAVTTLKTARKDNAQTE